MDKVRAFLRWMMIDPRHPEIAQAQYNELSNQIPSLYALLMVNAIAVSYTHLDVAPTYLTVGVLIPILLVSFARLVSWLRAKRISPTPEEAIRRLRQTVVIGSLVAVSYISWSLTLDGYGGPEERGHVALFIAITVMGCIYCLMNLPQAAFMVMSIVTIPYLIYYMQQDKDVYFAIGMNIFLVCLVALQVLISAYSGFCKLVRSQVVLAAKHKETERLNAENERLAQTDALTDLPNRRFFFQRVEQMIKDADSSGETFAVGLIDLDRFKPVNDTYGHKAGDVLLAEVGTRLKSLESKGAQICRLGGDEFGFLFAGPPDKAEETGQAIIDRISAPFKIGDMNVSVGASCGIALFPEAGRSAHELFDRADYALYNSKQVSRGGTTVFSEEHEARIRSENAIESALQSADFDAEFKVYFQPVVSLSDRTIVGFEALARWTNPVLGPVKPEHFIAVAERTAQINRLTLALFDKALRQLKQLPGELHLSFNLSAQDITSTEKANALLETIKRHGLKAQRITFEITETSVIGSYEAAETCMKTLREAGVKFALDDFGTGYSSLGYLHRLPIDCVKVDRSFVTGIHEPVAGGVVTSIINLCRSMKMLCIVEGVEDPNQLALLKALRCHLVQGYLFSPPLPFEDILRSAQETGTIAGLALPAATGQDALRLNSA